MGTRSTAELLSWATNCLEHQSTLASAASPDSRQSILRYEAEVLLQWATGWSRTEMLVRLAEGGGAVPNEAEAKFSAALNRRSEGVPLQYITGVANFYGRSLRVAPGCLIPRPETEGLVEAVIHWIRNHAGLGRVSQLVDVGTGSGAIAITLALNLPGLDVHAVDISAEALAIARENATRLCAAVTFHAGDAAAFLESQVMHPQVVVSNPPYIPTAEVATLEAEVRDYEPRLALDGGLDGLDFYRRLAALEERVWSEGPAALFLEVGAGQSSSVQSLFRDSGRWREWRFFSLHDLRGIERVVVGERC